MKVPLNDEKACIKAELCNIVNKSHVSHGKIRHDNKRKAMV